MRLQLGRRLLAVALALALLLGSRPAPEVCAETRRRSRPEVNAASSNIATKVSVEMSGYTDSDAVNVASPTIGLNVGDEVAGWSVGGRFLVDAVSAASVDIVATASPPWFEYRYVGSGNIDYKHEDVALSLSGGVSHEPDYLSLSGGLGISVETLDKNFTPSLIISYGHDDAGRTGLDHAHWEQMQRFSVQGGATFVLGRSTIASIAVDGIFERGYLAKPYRYVPLFAPEVANAIPVGASPALVNEKRLEIHPIDALPRKRDRYAGSFRIAHRLDFASLRLFQRLYIDDWGLKASTTDGTVMVDVGRYFLIWPHLRYHGQQAVSFWKRAYVGTPRPDPATGEVTYGPPDYRTGDRELGGLYTVTAGGGLKIFMGPGPKAPWSITLQADTIYTKYLDALYVISRRALFGAFTLDATFE
jgi:hypothetical protein